MKKIYSYYKKNFYVEVLSGGMILPHSPVHISALANYINDEYKNIEKLSGIKFGQDFLWHFQHPDQSDWYPNSEKPAIALCIFKEVFPELQVSFAADLQYALHFEGRDLTDDEAYWSILEKYNFNAEEFYEKLHDPQYKEIANNEFEICKQLKVQGYPAVFLQVSESKFYMLSSGYTEYEELRQRIENRLLEIFN